MPPAHFSGRSPGSVTTAAATGESFEEAWTCGGSAERRDTRHAVGAEDVVAEDAFDDEKFSFASVRSV